MNRSDPHWAEWERHNRLCTTSNLSGQLRLCLTRSWPLSDPGGGRNGLPFFLTERLKDA